MTNDTRTPAIETMLDTTHGSEGLALTFSNRGTIRINLRDLSDAIYYILDNGKSYTLSCTCVFFYGFVLALKPPLLPFWLAVFSHTLP